MMLKCNIEFRKFILCRYIPEIVTNFIIVHNQLQIDLDFVGLRVEGKTISTNWDMVLFYSIYFVKTTSTSNDAIFHKDGNQISKSALIKNFSKHW